MTSIHSQFGFSLPSTSFQMHQHQQHQSNNLRNQQCLERNDQQQPQQNSLLHHQQQQNAHILMNQHSNEAIGIISANHQLLSSGGSEADALQATSSSIGQHDIRPQRDPTTRPVNKLTVDLIKTYKHINEVSYLNKSFIILIELVKCNFKQIILL